MVVTTSSACSRATSASRSSTSKARINGVAVTLVGGQRRQTPAQKDDVHPRVLPGQRGEAVGGHLLAETEVLDEDALDATTSSTFRDTADEAIFISGGSTPPRSPTGWSRSR